MTENDPEQRLKASIFQGLMSLVRDGDVAAEDVCPMLHAFAELPPDEQTPERFGAMVDAARRRRRGRPTWRGDD